MQLITKEQLIVLEAVAKKAAGVASLSLSKLLGMSVELTMLRLRLTPVKELAISLATPEEQVAAAILPVAGELGGQSVLVSTLSGARRIAGFATKRSVEAGEELDELSMSALKETANIIGGAFLGALSDQAGISLVQSVPTFMADTMQSVVQTTAAKVASTTDEQTMVLEIDFSMGITTITTGSTVETVLAHYLFILSVAFAQKLLVALEK